MRLRTAIDIDELLDVQAQHRRYPFHRYPERLADEAREPLAEAIGRVPLCRSLRAAASQLIRVIHGIPDLFEELPREQIELYVGRTGATPRNLYGRLTAHRKLPKKHYFGAIALRCSTAEVQYWETVAVRVVNSLQRRQRLCVANVSASGRGPLPNARTSLLYVTWRRTRSGSTRLPRRVDIPNVVEDVVASTPGVRRSSLSDGLDCLTRPARDRISLAWVRFDR